MALRVKVTNEFPFPFPFPSFLVLPLPHQPPFPFLNEVVSKCALLSKYANQFMPTNLCHSTCCYVIIKQEALNKQRCAREGLTNEGRHHSLLLHKQAHDRRGIAELLHEYITRSRLTACEVGIFF